MSTNTQFKKLLLEKDKFTPATIDKQYYCKDDKIWSVNDLIKASESLEVKEMPIEELLAIKENRPLIKRPVTHLELAYHAKVAYEANTDYPILLDETGLIMDGHHRVINHLIFGKPIVKYKQFEVNPPATQIKPKKVKK